MTATQIPMFKVEVSWICQDAYGPTEPVEVVLHMNGYPEKRLRSFPDRQVAIDWAQKWMTDRGFTPGVVNISPEAKSVFFHPFTGPESTTPS